MTTKTKEEKPSLLDSILDVFGLGKKSAEQKKLAAELATEFDKKMAAAQVSYDDLVKGATTPEAKQDADTWFENEKKSIQTWFDEEKNKLAESLGEVCIKTGHDQKNRLVHFHKKGGKFRVLKSATGYSGEWLGKDDAEAIFAEQVASSQNQ